ncbi:hypothetical protein D3C86_1983510 [compost metagenome]
MIQKPVAFRCQHLAEQLAINLRQIRRQCLYAVHHSLYAKRADPGVPPGNAIRTTIIALYMRLKGKAEKPHSQLLQSLS